MLYTSAMLTLKQPDEFTGGPEHARAVAHAAFDVVNALGPGGGKGFVLLNDLRLESGDGVAWIDHLLLHRYGFMLIESRTCAAADPVRRRTVVPAGQRSVV